MKYNDNENAELFAFDLTGDVASASAACGGGMKNEYYIGMPTVSEGREIRSSYY